MKYTPKALHENVNISHSSTLWELLLLLGGILGILVIVYIVLGFAVDFVVPRLPSGLEQHLGSLYASAFEAYPSTSAERALQTLTDQIVKTASLQSGQYKVHLIPASQANALALPGGHIVVLSALLNELDSENELAFILAHELGHFVHRDHLRGLGRGLVLIAMSSLLFGLDNTLTNFLMQSLLTIEMRFSQGQETQADLFALETLNTQYGHIAGATGFFEKLAEEDRRSRLTYFFSTHPYPRDRIATLQQHIREFGYAIEAEIPLNVQLHDIPEPPNQKNTTLRDILGF
ncbi:peptidase M48, Ste24p [Candidatus Vecturithrix granuli]|uniref:Peptidase M48, Ste24p n=1 Tax=Vecturithrix granuli TaxID=1499967 RepID=A0A081C1R3_VECG1|nr:peptidase M48, Ste24p [Candidatus Vecturithrix granuli]